MSNEQFVDSTQNGSFLCFVGPTGAGKSALSQHLLSRFPEELSLAISATSRAPRPGEQDEREYFFLSESEFRARIESKEFFEWEETHGNFYGTPKLWIRRVVEDEQKVLLDIDVRGAVHFFSNFHKRFRGVLVLPPSVEEMITRIERRGGVDSEQLQVRLFTALGECQQMEEAIKKGALQHLIINDTLSEAIIAAEAIFKAESPILEGQQLEDVVSCLRELERSIKGRLE